MAGGKRYLAGASGPGWQINVRKSLVRRLVGRVLADSYGRKKLHHSSMKLTSRGIAVAWAVSMPDDEKAGWVVLDGRNRLRQMLERLGLRLGPIRVTVFRPRRRQGELYQDAGLIHSAAGTDHPKYPVVRED